MQEELIEKAKQYLANTYTRFPVVVTKGEGCWLWDLNGRRYLDFLAGIAVCNLGHAHPDVVEAVTAQAKKLFHVSNLFYMEPQIKAAQMLVDHSFGDKVFFCNSGAEANEAAIKLARRYSWDKHGEGRSAIVTMENSFHGRTIATVSATGQPKFRQGFEPVLEGFEHVPFNDINALAKSINEKTCAVMLELIQAEGGINVADKDYITKVRNLTKEKDILLIVDEVQTGMGRTGAFFAYEQYGIEPDIMSLAKALGNGFPVGAIVAKDTVMKSFVPGTHASTFGGNPLASAAVVATINTLIDDGVIKNCAEVGAYLQKGLLELKKKFPFIVDVRGMGLIWGIELTVSGDEIVREFLKEGIILNCTKGNVLRLVPPLVVKKEEIDIFLGNGERDIRKGESVKRDFTKLLDINKKECNHLLERARSLKALRKAGKAHKSLAGRSLAMIFEKASTRTRISFEAGMNELGGQSIFLSPSETQIGRGEPIRDTARVLSRYVDAVMIRTFSQQTVEELAKWATIPVINGLSDLYHPCQTLADILTIEEHKGDFKNIKIAYIGDGNNVANSWLEASILLGLRFSLATPEHYQPDGLLLEKARKNKHFFHTSDPFEAVKDADVVYTDVWVSMGQEKEKQERKKAFVKYKIDDTMLKYAGKDVIVMHCLPAYRGQEIAEDVFERFSDIIFDQAENRLHAQKALLEWLVRDVNK